MRGRLLDVQVCRREGEGMSPFFGGGSNKGGGCMPGEWRVLEVSGR